LLVGYVGEASMGTWLNIATWWACTIVTVVGLLLSFAAWYFKGARSGLRGIAWSLLPLAMYLTHAVALVGHIGSAVVRFATAFVLSPEAWAGVVLACLSIVLFLISGGIPLVHRNRRYRPPKDGHFVDVSQMGQTPPVQPARESAAAQSNGDDLGDVQEILRRHGIK
jgi:hypothetical protein